MKKIYITSALLASGISTFAQDAASSTGNETTFYSVLIGIIIVLSIVLLIVTLTLQKVVNVLRIEATGGKHQYDDDRGFWEKLLSLKPLAAEKEIELDHDYDGIKELNNPIPPWFNVLFYGTIVFGIIYLFVYHVFEVAPLQAKEYDNQVAVAEKMKEDYLKKAGNLVDENSVKVVTDQKLLAEGNNTYTARCAACHGQKGEGGVGPNLTDEYWLHGGTINDVFKTIKYGVPAKGMIAWQNTLNPLEMQNVSSYIMSLQGSNPPGAKEPQGEKAGATSEVLSPSPSDSAIKDTITK
jgi:cytochrome c oxidase cbb3-type subunit 3